MSPKKSKIGTNNNNTSFDKSESESNPQRHSNENESKKNKNHHPISEFSISQERQEQNSKQPYEDGSLISSKNDTISSKDVMLDVSSRTIKTRNEGIDICNKEVPPITTATTTTTTTITTSTQSSTILPSSSTTSLLSQPVFDKIETGEPSDNVHKDLLRVLELIRQERHLIANELYQSVKRRIREYQDTRSSILEEDGETKDTSSVQKNDSKLSTTSSSNKDDDGMEQNVLWACYVLENEKNEFMHLEQRAQLFQKAKENIRYNPDWILSHITSSGVEAYYKREEDGTLSLKLQGEITGVSLFEQVAVLREVDLYSSWAPFCTASRRLAQLGKIDVLGWFQIGGFSFLTRDACFRAMGCDCLLENGNIILVGQSVTTDEEKKKGKVTNEQYTENHDYETKDGKDDDGDILSNESESSIHLSLPSVHDDGDLQQQADQADSTVSDDPNDGQYMGTYLSRNSILDDIEFPRIPRGVGCGRMTIRKFYGVIDIKSPRDATTCIVANIDPNFKLLPQIIIDFCMKKMCGVLLTKLQNAARKAESKPKHNIHACRMRDDTFYEKWLLPKFRSFCNELGWEMPIVNALEVQLDGSFTPNTSIDTDIRSSESSGDSTQRSTHSSAPANSHQRDEASTTSSLGFRMKKWNVEQLARIDDLKKAGLALKEKNKKKQLGRSYDETETQDDDNDDDRSIVTAITHWKASLSQEKLSKSFKYIIYDLIPHRYALPTLFFVMIVLFYGGNYDYGMEVHRRHQLTLLESVSFFLTQMMSNIFKLLIFSCLHWIIMSIALVSEFDNIELLVPLEYLPSTRNFFIDNIRDPVLFFSGGIPIFALIKAIVFGLLYKFILVGKSFGNFLTSYVTAIGQMDNVLFYGIRLIAQVPITIIGSIINFLLILPSIVLRWTGLRFIISYGLSYLWRMMSKVDSLSFSSISYHTLEDSKYIMSRSVSFLLISLLMLKHVYTDSKQSKEQRDHGIREGISTDSALRSIDEDGEDDLVLDDTLQHQGEESPVPSGVISAIPTVTSGLSFETNGSAHDVKKQERSPKRKANVSSPPMSVSSSITGVSMRWRRKRNLLKKYDRQNKQYAESQ